MYYYETFESGALGVEILVGLGAAPDLPDIHGRTPIHAALMGERKSCQHLIYMLSPPAINLYAFTLYFDDSMGSTLLHEMIGFPNDSYPVMTKTFEKFLEKACSMGINLDIKDSANLTPMALLALYSKNGGDAAVYAVKKLLEAGADPYIEVGINPPEPLIKKVLENATGQVHPKVIEIFKSLPERQPEE